MELRKYQQEAVWAVYDYIRNNPGNPCVVIPTGGGKTPIIAKISKDVNDKGGRVMILSHVKELLEQSRKTLQRFDERLDVGIYSAGLGIKETGSRITIAGIQSVYSHAKEFQPFTLIIIDEAHLIPASGDGMYQTFLRDCKAINPNVRMLGMTATPFRTSTGPLCSPDGFLNEVCYTAEVRDLIQQGFLSPLVSKNGVHSADFKGLHTAHGEFIESEVDAAVNNHNEIFYAVREIVRRTEDRKAVLIFAASVSHAENIQRLLAEQSGKEVGLVTGKTSDDEREELLKRFRGETIRTSWWGDESKPLKYLVNVNVLTTGFDAPNIDCVALMRPTASPGLYVQMVGRGLRLCDGKKDCLILDYGENILRHGCVDKVFIRAKGGHGTAPMKECPKCQEVMHISLRVCPACGHVFETEQTSRNPQSAADEHILSGIEENFEVTVDFAIYQKWKSRRDPDAPPTIRILYATDMGEIAEWVCPEHEGWARKKFLQWWKVRSRKRGYPSTVDEALEVAYANELRLPKQMVVVKKSGTPFYNIKKCIF